MTRPASDKLIALAAGGTGGHLFPAESLARALMDEGYDILFATDARGKQYNSLGAEARVVQLRAATLKPGIVANIRAVAEMGLGVLQALRLLRREKPLAVVGFGGYPSVPAMFAAQLLGIPTILHEQNGVLGKANAKLAPKAKLIAASLPDTKGVREADRDKVTVTGNPVRAEIVRQRGVPYKAPRKDGAFRIFIMGGSQGAHVFSEVIPQAVALLPTDMQARLRIVQQCRPEDTDIASAIYEDHNINAEIQSFFNDVPEQLAECHLFIGRSGASTVAEIAVVGRPAIFVPLTVHADKQQTVNATPIVEAGGGWLIEEAEFTPENLATRLKTLLNLPQTLEKNAKAAHDCGRPEATKNLAALVISAIPAMQDGSGENSNRDSYGEAAE